ncbi:MAG: sulfurtransferase, partial [bacterium]
MSIDTNYAHPEALVSTAWVSEHLKDEGIRIIESNEDVLLYDMGHLPGAVHIDWQRDLQDHTIRDYI